MLKKISNYLHRIQIEHQVDRKQDTLSFAVSSPQGSWQCSILLERNKRKVQGFGFYSTIPQAVPLNQRTDMALFLMCLNNNRIFGNFEIDLKTGDIHFKTYIDCEQSTFSERSFDRTMLVNVSIMQQHLPDLLQFIKQERA